MRKVLFFSQLAQMVTAHEQIAHNLVRATLVKIVNKAKANARGGFKTGAFETGGWQKITYRMGKDGDRIWGAVGHPDMHFAYWEFGHYNIYTRRFERSPWLYPAMVATLQEEGRTAQEAVDEVTRMYATRTAGGTHLPGNLMQFGG